MATWQERDERWIVEDRADGHNVNGWHWQEKSALEHVRVRLGQLLPGTSHQPAADDSVVVKRLKEVTGEASITTRKGNKKAVIFDLQVSVEWEAKLSAHGSKAVLGELKVEDLASGLDPDDWHWSFTTTGTGEAEDACKKAAEGLKSHVTELLQQFVAELQTL